MSFMSLGGMVIYLYLGIIRYDSDTNWLLLSVGGALGSMTLAVFMCWGVMQLIQHSGVRGAYQCFTCIDATGTVANSTCTATDSCAPDGWTLIYKLSECEPAAKKGIYCELREDKFIRTCESVVIELPSRHCVLCVKVLEFA